MHETSSKNAKDALQRFDDDRSDLEDAKDFGDGSKKAAVEEVASAVSTHGSVMTRP